MKKHLVTLGIALVSLVGGRAAFSADIVATFMEDNTQETYTLKTKQLDVWVNDTAGEARSSLLAFLNQKKIDCGPRCVPKPVDDGVWECCDGRRVPPKGKVRLRVTNERVNSVFKKAFLSDEVSRPR